jgi:hypothetical protein
MFRASAMAADRRAHAICSARRTLVDVSMLCRIERERAKSQGLISHRSVESDW